jgi:acyl-coenzyme A synthetase/AMP-(fatty) acid ligase
MKNQNDIISLAPWIFGSSIFFKETENHQTMFNIFEQHPIDTFCASSTNYQLLGNQQQEKKTQLTQLFSTESVDLITKQRWHSMTNLQIHDGKSIYYLFLFIIYLFIMNRLW